MQQEFLNISPEIWNVIFLIIRYVLVALLLAYIANVYAKRKNIHTDIKGRVLEWRVSTYKSIHRWAMKFRSLIAAPSQDEDHFKSILAPTRFKIGYQGMEYASFFDSPERLFQFGIEFNRMLNKDEKFIDYSLQHRLIEFQYWLDDLIMFYGAFTLVENDKRWKFNEKTINEHCELASRVMGIALQNDVNKFYRQIDDMLRDRLRNLKISGVYTESWWTKMRIKATENCEAIMDKEEDGRLGRLVEWFYDHVLFRTYSSSQLLKNQQDLMLIFMRIHFEDMFSKKPSVIKDQDEFRRLTAEFYDCYNHYLKL